jgi:hypothetical protein
MSGAGLGKDVLKEQGGAAAVPAKKRAAGHLLWLDNIQLQPYSGDLTSIWGYQRCIDVVVVANNYGASLASVRACLNLR